MGSIKTKVKKARLVKALRRAKWAPVWLIPKIFGKGKKVHPSRISMKRNRKRSRIRA
jgi:ribosomal protein L39E